MNIDRTKLMEDIEAMKEKLASMEAELNKPEKFKHFPSEGDKYYYYDATGTIWSIYSYSDDLKVNAYKSYKEAEEAYNKAAALEKVKRRIIELQGDWKPDWSDSIERKVYIHYDYKTKYFRNSVWKSVKYPSIIPYIKSVQIADLIIYEMKDELKVIFDI